MRGRKGLSGARAGWVARWLRCCWSRWNGIVGGAQSSGRWARSGRCGRGVVVVVHATEPEEMPGITAAELAETAALRERRRQARIPWRRLLASPQLWLIAAGLLLLCVGKLVLLRLVYDLADPRGGILARADGSVCFVPVRDGTGWEPCWRRGERAAGDAVWAAADLSVGDRDLPRSDAAVAAGHESGARAHRDRGAGDAGVRGDGPDAAFGVGDVHEPRRASLAGPRRA